MSHALLEKIKSRHARAGLRNSNATSRAAARRRCGQTKVSIRRIVAIAFRRHHPHPRAKMAGEEDGAPAAVAPTTAKTAVHKTDYEKDVVYLYQFFRSPVTPSLSPYCLVVETFLRISGIRYENVDHKMKYKSKKGKIPFVEFNGAEIADSMIIMRQLGALLDKDLDGCLTEHQRAIGHAFAAMLNHHTSWAHTWWIGNHAGEYVKGLKLNLQQVMNTRIPTPLLNFVFKMKLKGKKKSAGIQGIGVHKPDEILEFARADLQALAQLLSDKPYFFGDDPSILDCVAFGHLVQYLYGVPDDSYPLRPIIQQKCPKLAEFVSRIKDRYWPDWDEMCRTLDLNTHLPKKKKDEEEEEDEDGDKKTKESGDDKGGEEEEEEDDLRKDGSHASKEKLSKDEKEEDANKLREEKEEEDK